MSYFIKSPSRQTRKCILPQVGEKQQSYQCKIPQKDQQTLDSIWDSFKKVSLFLFPNSINQIRAPAISLIIQCHRNMKLSIQVLYLATSIFDRVINALALRNQLTSLGNQIYVIAVTCLYSCQKMEKIRNYGINHWIKHLYPDNLARNGFPYMILSAENIKKYEGFILEMTNFNLFTSTMFDILSAMWIFKVPSQAEFYFAHYLLELSLYTEFNSCLSNQENENINTASSINQNFDRQTLLSIDIVIAIISLVEHFLSSKSDPDFWILKIWKQFSLEQNSKDLLRKKRKIKQISNILFQTLFHAPQNKHCLKTVSKYHKVSNMSVSRYQFFPLEKENRGQRDGKKLAFRHNPQ